MLSPTMARPFLTARWVNLILAQFPVPDELVTPYLPPGVEPDRWNGSAYVSLVPFQFRDTNVFGCRWPGFTNFPELNLRTYARCGDRQGVVFLREYIPSRWVSWVARTTYNEPYYRAPMTEDCYVKGDRLTVNYSLELGGRAHRLWAVGDRNGSVPDANSAEHFFKERMFGFGKRKSGETLSYEVKHPLWVCHAVRDYGIDLDWGTLYGPQWSWLNGVEPASLFLVSGSEVSVWPWTCQ
ncbi:MAG: DUF2071 domain-containing protein [Gemmataceae bacterium]